MRINNIKALDYKAQEDQLALYLIGTSLDGILAMDPALLRVETDNGDLVEAYAGYRIRQVVYGVEDSTFTVLLDQGAEDTTAATLAAIADALQTAEAENVRLSQLVDQQQAQLNDQADALIELAGLITEEG